MKAIEATLLGLILGLMEFLPVGSLGHPTLCEAVGGGAPGGGIFRQKATAGAVQ